MPRLEINLFGPPQVLLDGIEFDTERRKAIALLAYLAVEGKDQPREHLAALLWPDYERESALSYLRRELYEINSILGKGWLRSDRRSAGLLFGPEVRVDVREFEKALAEARTDEDPAPFLEAAFDEYRGDFLAGFYLVDTEPFEDWQRQQAETLRREYGGVLEHLAAVHEQRGEWEEALDRVHAWLALDELSESAHRSLMRIYAGMGDRSRAVRQYEDCRAALAEALSVSPQAETIALYERILQGTYDAAPPAKGQSAPSASNGQVSLPVLTTPFIGRRPEIEQVKELLVRPDTRLLTLLGPGGTGKTRLAIQSAGELAGHFPDGVWFIALAPVIATEDILPEIAAALSFSFYREDETPRRQLLDYLREKKLLLVLDNLEHLVCAETASLLVAILTEATDVRLAVTSRERLNIQAEKLFAVTGMRMPPPEEAASWTDPESQAKPYSAMQLFVDRAARVQPGFTLNRTNARAVAEICALVSGMPLGLELAASWLELLPPDEIAAEIRRSMDFLETDQPDVPERQRSLRAVFDYSWKLLNEIEKDVFLNLNVFEGSFSRAAAQAVSDGSLRTFLSLANKSWLQQGEDGRFQLHPLLRIYGKERLQADGENWRNVRDRHAAYYADFIAEQAERLRGAGQLQALTAITEEYGSNLRAAWDWLVDNGQWQVILEKMAAGLFQYGIMRWRGESMVEWFRRARQKLEDAPGSLERTAYVSLGTIEIYFEESWNLKQFQPEKRLARLWEIVNEHDLEEAMGIWFVILGVVFRERNFSPETTARLSAALARFREGPDPWVYYFAVLIESSYWGGLLEMNPDLVQFMTGEVLPFFKNQGAIYEQASILQFLADNAAAERRPIEEVIDLYMQAQDKFLELDDRFGFGMMYWQWANQYFTIGQPEKGFEGYERMQAVFEQLGNQAMVGMVLAWRALWTARYRDYQEAFSARHRSLVHNLKYAFGANEIWDVYEMGEVYRIFGHFDQARRQFEAARVEIERFNLFMARGYLKRSYGDLAFVDGRFEEALRHYETYLDYMIQDNHGWSITQAHSRIAWAQASSGRVAEAREHIRVALNSLKATSEDVLILSTLLAEARCLIEEGLLVDAAALAAFIVESPITWNEIRDQGEALLEELDGRLSTGEPVFESRYAGREVKEIAEAWLGRYGSV